MCARCGDDAVCGRHQAVYSDVLDLLSRGEQHLETVKRVEAGEAAGAVHYQVASAKTMLGDHSSAVVHLTAAFNNFQPGSGDRLGVGSELGGALFKLGQTAEFTAWDLPTAAMRYRSCPPA